MTKIKNFVDFKKTKGFQSLNPAIVSALAGIAKEYGVSISTAGVSYSDGFADIKLHLALTTGGEAETKEMMAFRQLAHYVGLEPSDLLKQFRYQYDNYKIIGLRSGRKNPVLCKNLSNDKTYFFPVEIIKEKLALSYTKKEHA